MFETAWYAVVFGGAAMSAIAGLLAPLRMRRREAMGRINAELAAYYAPMLDEPVLRVEIGFSLRESQQSRMAQGRALKLMFSGHHREIGDPWLSAWVLIQR